MKNFEEKTESEGLTVSIRWIHCLLAERVARASSRCGQWHCLKTVPQRTSLALIFDNMIEFVSL